MPVPTQVNDGDFAIAQVNGVPAVDYPFSDEGDFTSWEWKPKLRMDGWLYYSRQTVQYFLGSAAKTAQFKKPLSKWVTPLGAGYLIDPGQPQDVGGGLLEWTPTIASLPVNRIVGQTLTQLFQARNGYAILYEQNIPTNAQVLKEYSLTPFTPRYAPKIFANPLGQIVAFGDFSSYTFSPSFGANVKIAYTVLPTSGPPPNWTAGSIIVGQDSKATVYKGGMYYRETLFVTVPNFQTFSP